MIFNVPDELGLLEEFEEIEESSTSSKVPQSSRQNLESKIDSLVRSIENLSQKKLRIEFELRRQKMSLVRKRNELKRVSKTSQAKINIKLESDDNSQLETISVEEQKRIQTLLRESARVLEG